jgi:hypothetical protein
VAAGGGGAIVNLASTAGFSARVGAAHYSASKAGVVMLTKSMAQELGPHGIRVNAVAPGFIEVREDQVSPAYKKQMIGLIPLGRPGKAPNIANTVAFLVSDDAEFITGECVVVDGGLLTGRQVVRSGSLGSAICTMDPSSLGDVALTAWKRFAQSAPEYHDHQVHNPMHRLRCLAGNDQTFTCTLIWYCRRLYEPPTMTKRRLRAASTTSREVC